MRHRRKVSKSWSWFRRIVRLNVLPLLWAQLLIRNVKYTPKTSFATCEKSVKQCCSKFICIVHLLIDVLKSLYYQFPYAALWNIFSQINRNFFRRSFWPWIHISSNGSDLENVLLIEYHIDTIRDVIWSSNPFCVVWQSCPREIQLQIQSHDTDHGRLHTFFQGKSNIFKGVRGTRTCFLP